MSYPHLKSLSTFMLTEAPNTLVPTTYRDGAIFTTALGSHFEIGVFLVRDVKTLSRTSPINISIV